MSMEFDKKSAVPNEDAAQEILTKILVEKGTEPNSVSLTELNRKTRKRKIKMLLSKIICIVLLAFVIIVPIWLMIMTGNSHSTASVSNEVSDTTSPRVVDHYKNGDYLYISFTDDNGIDFDSLQIVTVSGNDLPVESVNRKDDTICFKYPTESTNIFISDLEGNQLQTVITIH